MFVQVALKSRSEPLKNLGETCHNVADFTQKKMTSQNIECFPTHFKSVLWIRHCELVFASGQ